MTIEGSCVPSVQFRRPHYEIHFLDACPIKNRSKMPQASEDHCPDMVAPKNTPISFVAKCVGDSLEEQS